MKKLGIFFDLDGTLIDSAESIYEAFEVAFKHHHQTPPDKAQVISLIGGTLEDMFRSSGVIETQLHSYINAYKEYYRSIALDKTILLPHSLEAVQQAAKHASLAIVTTKIQASSQKILKKFDLLDYFSCVIGRDNTTYPKPHAEPILNAIKQSGQDYSKIFMIGDTTYDLLSAKNAAAQTNMEIIGIGVLSGYGLEQELRKHSPYVVQNVSEAISLITKL